MKKHIISVLRFIKRDILLRSILELKKRNILPKFIPRLFLGYSYQSFKFVNIESYCITRPNKIKFIFKTPAVLSYFPPRFDRLDSDELDMAEVINLNNYAAILFDVEIIGGSNLVLFDDSNALLDMKSNDIHNKMYYSDFGIRYYHNEYLLVKTIKSDLTIDKAIYLGGNFSWNYYHLIYDILAKLQKISEFDIASNIPILIDSNCLKTQQYQELFTLLNNNNRTIIIVDKGIRYHVKQLYHFSCPNIIPPDLIDSNSLKAEDVLIDLEAISFLRSNLLKNSSGKSFPKRFFISRSKASGRRNYNEEEVFSILEKHDFKMIFPEDYSIIDQIALFNNAEFIAGGAGAAFTNLLFCKESCKIITFAKTRLPFAGFSTIAKFVGAEMLCFTEEFSNPSEIRNIHDTYTIDTARLNNLISKWI